MENKNELTATPETPPWFHERINPELRDILNKIDAPDDVKSSIVNIYRQDIQTESEKDDFVPDLLNKKGVVRRIPDPTAEQPVVFIDLNKFKWINDKTKRAILPTGKEYPGGHALGDYLLKTVGELMVESRNEAGVKDVHLGRAGGDEYQIFGDIGVTPKESIDKVAKILQNKAKEISIEIEDQDGVTYDMQGIPLSVGFGESLADADMKAMEVKNARPEDPERQGIPETLVRRGKSGQGEAERETGSSVDTGEGVAGKQEKRLTREELASLPFRSVIKQAEEIGVSDAVIDSGDKNAIISAIEEKQAETTPIPKTPPVGSKRTMLSSEEMAKEIEKSTIPESVSRDIEIIENSDGTKSYFKDGKPATKEDITGETSESWNVRNNFKNYNFVKKTINLKDIVVNKSHTNRNVVEDLKNRGVENLPLPVVYFKKGKYHKIDGMHRLQAAKESGIDSVEVYLATPPSVKSKSTPEKAREVEATGQVKKEPWQMTRDEYLRDGIEYVAKEKNGEKVSYFPTEGAVERKARTDHGHKYHIKQAIADGKFIPPEALKDYPDLIPEGEKLMEKPGKRISAPEKAQTKPPVVTPSEQKTTPSMGENPRSAPQKETGNKPAGEKPQPIGTVWITTEAKQTGSRPIYAARTISKGRHKGKMQVKILTGKDQYRLVKVSADKVKLNKDNDVKFQMAEDDYRGSHTAPRQDDGASLDDLSNVFPDDIYGPRGAQYYGHYGQNDPMDVQTISIISAVRGKPNARVTIYRAVPRVVSSKEQIAEYEKHKAYILKRGKLPPGVTNWPSPSKYYDFISDEIDRLSGLNEGEGDRISINPGDWVTINKKYAKEHGEAHLDGQYRIIQKTVRAKDLFTDGNSIHEWGYNPSQVKLQPVYHGTPHIWPPEPGFPHGRPRLDKIFSKETVGEGNWAKGAGWYSTDTRDIGSQYADKFSRSKILPTDKIDGDFVIRNGTEYPIRETAKGESYVDTGSLYKLDIPDDVMPKLLDWDKPLSEQSEYVKKKLGLFNTSEKRYNEILDKLNKLQWEKGGLDSDEWNSLQKEARGIREKNMGLSTRSTGEDIYAAILQREGEKDGLTLASHPNSWKKYRQAASEYLASIGIPGNKYLDGMSRGKGEGSYNYVIWDQPTLNRVALLERNGEKLDAIRDAQMQLRGDTATPITSDMLDTFRSVFPKRRIGRNPDGTIWVEVRKGKQYTVKSVDKINPDTLMVEFGTTGAMKQGQKAAGAYRGGKVLISRADADVWTIRHEDYHALKEMGLITGLDSRIIRGAAKKEGIVFDADKAIDAEEAEARFITDGLKNREKYRNTPFGKILQKIKDFIDSLRQLVVKIVTRGKKTGRTAYSVLKDIEKDRMAGEGEPVKSTTPKTQNITAERDARYLELAKDPEKNKTELQKMVDEAAREAGYGTILYHGTDGESASDILSNGIDQSKSEKGYFGSGFYTTPDEELARNNYADFSGDEDGGAVVRLAIRDDAKIIDTANPSDYEIYRAVKVKGRPAPDMVSEDDYHKYMVNAGIDGLSDNSFGGTVVYNERVVKSADPVTRDDQGNVIPLSERFNDKSDDIRFSGLTFEDIDPEKARKGKEAVDRIKQRIMNARPKEKKIIVSEPKTDKLINDFVQLKQTSNDSSIDLEKRIKDYKEFLMQLPIYVRGKAMAGMPTLLKAKTYEAKEKAFKKAKLTADRYATIYIKQQLKKELHKLRRIGTKNKPGQIKKSNLGPEARQYLDLINKHVFGNQINTAKKVMSEIRRLYGDLEELYTEEPTDDNLLKAWRDRVASLEKKIHVVQVFGGIKDMTIDGLQSAVTELNEFISDGRSSWTIQEKTRKAEINRIMESVAKEITGEDNPQIEDIATKKERQDKEADSTTRRYLSKISNFDTIHQSWRFLLDKLTRKSDKGTLKTDAVTILGDMAHHATNEANRLNQEAVDMMADKVFELTGKRGRAAMRWIDKHSRERKKYELNPTVGETKTINLSDMEAAYWWAVYRRGEALEADGNSSVLNRLAIMGVGEDLISQVENKADKRVINLATWLSDVLGEKLWGDVNEAYMARMGAKLTHSEWYTPIKADFNRGPTKDENIMSQFNGRPSLVAGSLHELTNTSLGVKPQNLLAVWIDHVYEMNHFASWAIPVQTMDAVFSDPAIKNYIERVHGNKMNWAIGEFINHFKAGQKKRKEMLSGLDSIRSKFSTAVIGANPTIYLKQLTSIPAMGADIPASEFVKGMADFMINPVAKSRILGESQLIRTRYGKGHTRDVALAMRQTVGQTIGKVQGAAANLMFMTRLGDMQAIYAGGWSVYKYNKEKFLKAGMSEQQAHKKALFEFEKAVGDTQQSGEPMYLGLVQQGSPMEKLFTMFMTAPTSYYREMSAGLRSLQKKGRQNKIDGMKRLILFGIIVPAMFESIASAPLVFGDDEDQELFAKRIARSIALGPINGLFIARDIGEAIWNRAFIKSDAWLGADYTSVTQSVDDTLKIVSEFSKGTDNMNYDKIIEAAIDLFGYSTGLPTPAAQNVIRGWMDVANDETEHPIARSIGYGKGATNE